MILFGGGAGAYQNDVWALSLDGAPAWTLLAPSGTPPDPRVGHTAVYDAIRHRMVVFGGMGSTSLNDAWALSLQGDGAWTALAPTGAPPPGRGDAAAIYDPQWDRMIVAGGYPSTERDAWVLRWSSTTVDAPPRSPVRDLSLSPDPNPSSGRVRLRFDLPVAARAQLLVFDLQGRRIRSIVDGPLPAGRHEAWWDGTDGSADVPPGVYFCRLQVGSRMAVRRIVLVK
jgi:hypothetical protein